MKAKILPVLFLLFSIPVLAAPPAISSFLPTTASFGMTVTISGTDLATATAVSFGGTPATSFSIVSATTIKAIVPAGSTGAVQVITVEGTASLTGFRYTGTAGIITDFNGYWNTKDSLLNPVAPDNSHHLLAFTTDGITYSTSVKDSILTARGVSFTAGNFKALPVASVNGNTSTGGSVYIALAKNVDGSAAVANTANVADYTIMKSLTDGVNGLDLGTGITNLPSSANLSFQIFSIDPSKISDSEPDLVLTQIASPSSGNDVFSLVDAFGVTVGNSKTQDMSILPKLGSYQLDLFTLTPSTPYNKAKIHGVSTTGDSRDIRIACFRLSDFGITPANAHLVKALRIAPSSNSDYAFIAYNANSINLPPNVTRNDGNTTESICSGGTAYLEVIATAASGGTLSYVWEEQEPASSSWTILSASSKYINVNSSRLTVINADHGAKYRVRVTETGNANPALSPEFQIAIVAPAPPTGVTITSGSTVCLNTVVQLESTVTGGSSRFYQWQKNVSGTYENLEGENGPSFVPPVNQTGSNTYRLQVSGGSGCGTALNSTASAINVTGIATTSPAAVCNGSMVTLNATATSGSVNWYATDNGGSSLSASTSYSPGVLASTRTYFVLSSGCSAALRVPVTATVYPATAGGNINGGGSVQPGINSTTLSLASNIGSIVKWQSSTDAFAFNITEIAHTGNQLTVTNLSNDMQYRALVQSGTCAGAFSGTGSVTMFVALAMHEKSVRVSADRKAAMVQWTATPSASTAYFEVERSAVGTDFASVAKLAAGTANIAAMYKWPDQNPLPGISYYRIREVSKDGRSSLSEIANFVSGNNRSSINLYPNPVSGDNINIKFNQVAPGSYKIMLFNQSGQVVAQQQYQHDGSDQVLKFAMPLKLPAGSYKIKLGDKVFNIVVL